MNLDLMLHLLGVVDVFMVLSIIKIDKIMMHTLFGCCVVFDLFVCGQVFKGARWMPWH